MNRLTLEWVELGQVRTQTIIDQTPTKHPGTFRIGRDPQQCDLIVQHPTVSKLHIEIFFNPQQSKFYLRNLRDTNPPLVDQHWVTDGIAPLHPNSVLLLGQLEMRVREVNLALLPTVVTPPPGAFRPAPPPAPRAVSSPSGQVPLPQAAGHLSYGLQCPKCQRISPYEHLEVGCAWCGTSLAAAPSILIAPEA